MLKSLAKLLLARAVAGRVHGRGSKPWRGGGGYGAPRAGGLKGLLLNALMRRLLRR